MNNVPLLTPESRVGGQLEGRRQLSPVHGVCGLASCGKPFTNVRPWMTQKYCSTACRVAAYEQRTYVRVRPRLRESKKNAEIPTSSVPRCWCGKVAHHEENGHPKCGNHAMSRRAAVAKRNRLIKALVGDLTAEQLERALAVKARK